MAETKRGVILRLSADGTEQVKAALRALGKDGEEALRKVERSAKTVPPQLRLVNTASLEAQRGMQGLAARGGAATSALAGLGKIGLVAGAGLAAVGLAIGGAMRVAREAVREFDELAKTIRDLGLDSDTFQGLSFAALEQGIPEDQLNDALRTYQVKAGEAALGTGDLVEKLKLLDPELLKNIQSAATFDERLRLMFDGLARMPEGAERARLAVVAFGESNIRVGQLAAEGAAGIDRFVERARDLGLVIHREVLKNAEEMENRLGIAAKVVDINLKQAFVDLAPVIVVAAEKIAGVARAISSVIDMTRAIEDRVVLGPLRDDLAATNDEIKKLVASRDEIMREGITPAAEWMFGDVSEQVARADDDIAAATERAIELIERIKELTTKTSVIQPPSTGSGNGPQLDDPEGDRIRQVIDGLKHQADQLARTGAAQAAYNALVQAGIDQNHAMAPAVMGAATALYQKQAAAKAAADSLQAAAKAEAGALAEANKRIDETRALSKDALTSFLSDLRAGKDATEALGNAIGNLGERLLNSGIDALFAGLFPSVISPSVPLFHSGGMASEPTSYRSVPAAMFAGAPRFHSGIGPGERPAIIRNDEGVFTPGQMRALGGTAAKGQQIVQNFYVSAIGDRELEMKLKPLVREGAIEAAKGEVRQYDKGLPQRVAEISSDPRAR